MATRSLDYIINLREGTYGSKMNASIGKAQRLDNTFKRLIGSAAAFFSLQQGAQLIQETSELQIKMESLDTQLRDFSGSSSEYVKNMEAINRVTTEFHTPIDAAREGLTKWYTASTLAGLEGETARKTFIGLSMASRVLRLDAQRYNLVQNAMTQMLSKGRVSAEELRQQLGEHLPGAFAMAARAMNVTLPQLNKMLEKGQIDAVDFVRRFSDQMITEYGSRIPNAMQSTQAKIDGLNNKILAHQMGIGKDVIPLYLKWIEVKVQLYEKLQLVAQWYEKHKEVIHKVVVITAKFLGLLIAVKSVMWIGTTVIAAYNGFTMAMSIVTGKAAIGTWGLVSAMTALRAVMITMGIGLVTAALGGLALAAMSNNKPWQDFNGKTEKAIETLGQVPDAATHAADNMNKYWEAVGGAKAKSSMATFKQATLDIDFFGEMKLQDGVYGYHTNNDGYSKYRKRVNDAYNDIHRKLRRDPRTGFPIEDPYAIAFTGGDFKFDYGKGETGPWDKLPKPKKNKSTNIIRNETISSGRSVRNVSVKIDNGVKIDEFHTNNVTGQSLEDIKRALQDVLNRAVLDFESAL